MDRRQWMALAAGAACAPHAQPWSGDKRLALETPYKHGALVLGPSGIAGQYDSHTVDCPFVFRHRGAWCMTFVAFDGQGYQTGLATSNDLLHWTKVGCVFARDPRSPTLRHNAALNWILRDNALGSPGRLTPVGGRYLAAYHAYPDEGLEQGAAVIGLATSTDLLHWEPGPVILRPQDGAPWEQGGLYKPCLVRSGGRYHLFYNAKNRTDGSWHEQTGVAVSDDLVHWTRHPGNPVLANGGPGSLDEIFASDPCVLRNGDEWVFFYFGMDARGVARELVATGPSLTQAVKRPAPLVDVGAPGSIDWKYAHKPSVVHSGDALYHFYCAVGGDRDDPARGIAVARSRRWP